MSTPVDARRNILSGAVGNLLEWYDFAVYGSLAPVIGRLFFPADDPLASLLAAFGVFAIGYAARPIGGIVLGHIGDRLGRKPALILSVLMMGGCTALIGVLPTHAEIGTAAPVLLIALRILQGLSVGGEYPGSIVFLIEHAPRNRRAFFGSWPATGCCFGILLGTGLTALVSNLMNEAAFDGWGWRLPFLLGAAIAVCAALFRRQMNEPAALASARPLDGPPIVAAFRDHWRSIVQIVGLTLVNAVGFYLLWVYAVSYLTDRMHVSTARALDISTLSLVAMVPFITLSAIVADRIGRKPVLYFQAIGSLVFAWPLWWLMHHQSFVLILSAQIGFAVLFGCGFTALSATMAEILPTGVRFSAAAIGFNLCFGIFGGTTPLVATYLVARTADDFAPAYYLMAVGLVSLLFTFAVPETAEKALPD